MKIKEKYVEVSVESLDFLRKNAVITAAGSILSQPITVNGSDVTVNPSYEDDKDFVDNGFGDIAF